MNTSIINWVFVILITIILVYKSVKNCQHTGVYIEKIIYILGVIVWIIPWFIYFLDSYDLPTKLGYIKNVDTDRWFEFVSTYVTAIVGAIISGIILWLITYRQIKVQIESNRNDKRIQNAPILKYDISNKRIKTLNDFFMYNGDPSNDKIYCLFFKIENIGLNHARHIYILVKGDDIKNTRQFKLDDSQSILEKGSIVTFKLIIDYRYVKQSYKKLYISICYEDVLNNKYIQNINIIGEPTNTFCDKCEGYEFVIKKCEIENEKFI